MLLSRFVWISLAQDLEIGANGKTCEQRNIKKQVSDVVEVSLNEPKADMWDKVLSSFKLALDKAEEAYLKKATSKLDFPPFITSSPL